MIGKKYWSAVKAELEAQGKTVYWLAKQTDINKETLYTAIRRGAEPKAETNRRITNALDVPTNYFLQALAKPEEPGQAVAKWEPITETVHRYTCPVCTSTQQRQYNYCPVCGTLLGRCKA